MTIFVYKGFTRYTEIVNWRLGWVRDTKFGTNVSDRKLLNAAKFQDYSFYRFWVIKWKPTRGQNYPPPTKIRVKAPLLADIFMIELELEHLLQILAK